MIAYWHSDENGRLFGRARTRPADTRFPGWRRFVLFEAVLTLIYCPFGLSSRSPVLGFLGWREWAGQVPAWCLLGTSAVTAIVYGVRRHRPNAPIAWWFIAAGVLLFITGDTVYKFWHQIMGQQNIPFPSFIDVIYITMYPVLAIGLLLLARARVKGGDKASLFDALIITLGVGLLSWIFLIGPNVRAPGGLLVRLTAAAYPLGDILVLAMLAHLWSSGGLRNTAGRLLAIGAVGTLISDSLYGLANLHPSWNWHDGNPIDLGWVAFYACWGAAALHPSMRGLSEPRPSSLPRTGRTRLALLAVASLVGPGILLVESVRHNTVDAPVIAIAAGVMFLLVVMRMAGLVKAHRSAVTREQVLRHAVAELVAAPGAAEIHEATVAAANALVSERSDIVGITLAAFEVAGGVQVLAQSGRASTRSELRAALESAGVLEALHQGEVARSVLGHVPTVESKVHALLCPLVVTGRAPGVIAVTSVSELPAELSNSIEILAAQAGLALDRDLLSETFHTRRSEARFETLVQNASDVILIARTDSTITYQTPSVKTILGYEPSKLEGAQFSELLHPEDVQQALTVFTRVASRLAMSVTAQWRVRHGDGGWRHVEVVANNLLSDPTVEGIVLTMRDVSERKRLEDELKHQAFHDALSGLANRALFRDRLEHALARAARSGSSLAVMFLDLDDFKLVNDSLGHKIGDELLVSVGGRLVTALRGGDTAARLGGDEFAVLLEEIASPEEAFQVADRIIAELRPPLVIAEHEVLVRVSVGIALSVAGTEDPSDLLQAADVAMYAAKASGKGRYEVYHPALQQAMAERLERTAELQRAVDQREFVIHYQPIVNLENDRTVGVEALVRWHHPVRGLLPPNDFVPLAEETGLIIPMGRWVLEEACRQAGLWQRKFGLQGRLRVSVNVSARQFQNNGLVDDVSRALRTAGLDPGSLVLEITESVLVQEAEAVIARMFELKALGIGFAIDDFGTGYSSLSYLKRFPIDILKVDKSFVDDIGRMPEDAAFAEAIVQLGKTLNLQTIAEGIERAPQAEELRAIGCQFGQGFLFAKPLGAEGIEELLSGIVASGVVAAVAR